MSAEVFLGERGLLPSGTDLFLGGGLMGCPEMTLTPRMHFAIALKLFITHMHVVNCPGKPFVPVDLFAKY